METTEKEWLKVPEAAELLGLPKPEPTNLSSRVSFRPSVSGSGASGSIDWNWSVSSWRRDES
jgi:hypothetical protein